MSYIQNCTNCRTSLSQFAPLYYCCDQQRLICRRCKPYYCQTCKKSDWKEIKEMHCLICKRKVTAKEALREEICREYFCPRCIAHQFLPSFLTKDPPIIIQMRCGHFIDKQEIMNFLTDYCINCGFKFKPNCDFQLQNGMKFCEYCFNYDDKKPFQNFFQLCFSCSRVLTYKETSKCKQFLLCHRCSENQSLIEQSIRSNPFETKPTSIVSQIKSEQSKPAQKYEEDEQPSEQLSITSRFSAMEMEEKGMKRKGKLISTLSKNSVQIRVQNYKLPSVVLDSSSKLTKCYLCNSFLQESGTLPNTTHSSSRICKMCFSQTFDKSYLSYTRYNNYLQNQQRTTSLAKQQPIASNPMKLSMLPPQYSQAPSHSKQTHLLSSLLKNPVQTKVEKKQTWQTQTHIKNPCQICKVKATMIIRADKKRVCVDCQNKHN